MTILLAICVSVIFAVSVYLMLGRELKSVAMGMFLFTHAAHLGILAMSGQPIIGGEPKGPPVLLAGNTYPVDPLPQALILTSIVISFAVMAFFLTLIVVTQRRTGTLDLYKLAEEDQPDPPVVD